MKQPLLLVTLFIGIACSGYAQTTDTTSDPGYDAAPAKQAASPTLRAAHQLTVLQKKLNLTQDQVIKLRMVLLNFNISLDSLRTNPSTDKKANNQARRAITQDTDGKIYALLTTDQQAAYAKWKQEQQLKRQMNRAANKAPAIDTTTQHR
jgi:Spy/CpxP family protein refolding chaperone